MKDTLILTPIGNGEYEVVEDFKDVPKGFVTDGGSIPRFFWRVIGHPFESEYIDRYVEHDYDYAVGSISRKEADEKLREGLKADGMGFFKRNLIYFAVRWFGAKYYNSQRDDKVQ